MRGFWVIARTKPVLDGCLCVKLAPNMERHKRMPHGGPHSVPGSRSTIVDFSSNVNPLGCPSVVNKALRNAMGKIPVYPDHDSALLKEKIAKYLGVSEGNLVIGNGATEIIYNFCRATMWKDRQVLIPAPTFGEYEAASRLCGARISFFKTTNLQGDVNRFSKKIPKNGIVFVCNPNNPTGELVQRDVMLKILHLAKKRRTLVFIDECFIELTFAKESLVENISEFENLFILRSLTKSFGLAGLRIGYGIGDKKIISVLDNIKIPWSVSGIAQEAALLALSDKKFLSRTQKLIHKESKYLKNSISKIPGFSCSNSMTNFILIKTNMNSGLLQQKLLKKGILVRDCSTFRGLDSHYIRIAVRTHKENLLLVKTLEKIR